MGGEKSRRLVPQVNTPLILILIKAFGWHVFHADQCRSPTLIRGRDLLIVVWLLASNASSHDWVTDLWFTNRLGHQVYGTALQISAVLIDRSDKYILSSFVLLFVLLSVTPFVNSPSFAKPSMSCDRHRAPTTCRVLRPVTMLC